MCSLKNTLQSRIIEDEYDADDHYSAHAEINWDEQPGQVQGRTPFQGLKKNGLDDIKNSRFLSYLLSSNSLNLLSLLRMSSTSTTFLLATITSTLTSDTLVTCFTSTVQLPNCRRRRRNVMMEEIHALPQGRPDVLVVPSQILP